MPNLICNDCGFTTDEDGAKYCPNCGATLERQLSSNNSGESNPVQEIGACSVCGSPKTSPDDQFCLNCGTSFQNTSSSSRNVIVGAPAITGTGSNAPAIRNCPNCGSPMTKPSAKFCVDCGHAFEGVAATPVVTQAAPSQGQQYVGGRALKMVPIAMLIQDNLKTRGAISLFENGIVFTAFGAPKTTIHVSEIAQAAPGKASNLLDITLANGTRYQFRMTGASHWAPLINKAQGKK